MNKWLAIEFIINIIDVFLIFYFVKVLLHNRHITKFQTAFIVIIQAIINSIINNNFGIASLLGFSMMVLTTGILYLIAFKEHIFTLYLSILIALIVNLIIEMVVVNILSILGISPEVIVTYTIYRVLAVVAAKSLFFLTIVFGVSKIKIYKFFNSIRIYQLYLIFIPNVILIFLAFWFYKYVHAFDIPFQIYITLITITILIFTLALFQILRKIIDHTKKETIWREKEEEYRLQSFYLNNIQQLLDIYRAQRHDFNNHLSCIYGLVKLQDYNELKAYIENLTSEISDFNTLVNLKNPFLTSLLNIKVAKAKSEDIQINLSIDIEEEIKIKPIDLSSVIGNLLDNAIEACKEVDKGERYIDVELFMRNGNLIIKISNTKVNKIDSSKLLKEKYTTKDNSENHGYGLLNVKKIIDRYNGIIKIDEGDNLFKVSIAIPQRNKE